MAFKLFSRRSNWTYVVPFVAVGAGLLFGVSARVSHGTDLRPGTTSLAGVVHEADDKVKGQQSDVNKLRNEIQTLTNNDKPSSKELKDISAQADKLAPSSGLTPVTGNAVKVTLTDSTWSRDQLPEGCRDNNDCLVVHQADVQAVVNAFWKAGATSMMLMDQRVISTSAVRCVGNTLQLQGRVYSPPFVISAIGDVSKLKKSLDEDDAVESYRGYVVAAGLGYKVETEKTTFPAYGGSLAMSHARPAS